MVQSKADRERQKLITDKCQSLIEVLLKDEDNKYCVDCDAKGPRWASWNLGVFLCIRCAGIHRNLGVHISKVKSVNLDAWTPEHVAYVQRMGNSRARGIYEANLPDDFRRPQTDTALESFIRAKYEHKKYIAQDYVDPGPPLPAFDIDDELKRIKEQKRSKLTSSGTTRLVSVPEPPSNPKPRPIDTLSSKNKAKITPGLVDLETVAATEAAGKNNKSALDLLIGVELDSPIDQTTSTQQTNESGLSLAFTDSPVPITNNSFDLDLDFTTSASPTSQATDSASKMMTKESILSLYSQSPSTNAPNTAGTDLFGINSAKDFFSPASNARNTGSTVGALPMTANNIPNQNLNMMNMNGASGISSLLGSNNNSFSPKPDSDQLLSPFDNPLVGSTNSQKFPNPSGSTIKNSSLDELFAGLDILHPKPI